jgi:hypothetical protein
MGEVAREGLRAGWSGTLFSALRAILEFFFWIFIFSEAKEAEQTQNSIVARGRAE